MTYPGSKQLADILGARETLCAKVGCLPAPVPAAQTLHPGTPRLFMSLTPALRIRGLRKRYANGVEALRGIDLDVGEGDFFALLGRNGAGKSTLIGIVSSLVNASAGEVEIFGVDLIAQRHQAMRLLGLVPQEINFNPFEKPFDILVNYAGFHGVPRAEAARRAHQELERAQLAGKADVISRSLSGGMKRRLMIARALMTRPRLLILDEPTAGVDIEIRRAMWKQMQQINADGTTVILTTHYLEEAENLCRNIAIIDQGRLIQHSSMAELLSRLDAEGFVLDLASALPASLPQIDGVSLHARNATTLELDMPRSMDLNHVFAALDTHGIRVRSLRNRSNRLEELFVRLTEKTED